MTATIDVPVLDNDELEADETVIVTLNTRTFGDEQITIDSQPATITISDDDTAELMITATSDASEPATAGRIRR